MDAIYDYKYSHTTIYIIIFAIICVAGGFDSFQLSGQSLLKYTEKNPHGIPSLRESG